MLKAEKPKKFRFFRLAPLRVHNADKHLNQVYSFPKNVLTLTYSLKSKSLDKERMFIEICQFHFKSLRFVGNKNF